MYDNKEIIYKNAVNMYKKKSLYIYRINPSFYRNNLNFNQSL